jgi:glucose-1-phosphate thymidylyltransferase
MKAIVLAGGKGTRLRPITYNTPKQLIPIANRPVLHYVLTRLQEVGIKEVGMIIAPETGDQIKQAVARDDWDFEVTYITQEEPLGLAHAVQAARDFLADESFIMCLGDNLIGESITGFIEQFNKAKSDALVLLKEVADPRMLGVAEVDEQGRLKRLVEKPEVAPSNLALVGLYIFSPSIHEAISHIKPSGRGELEITDAIQQLLDAGRRVDSCELKSWWLDTGKKDDLLEANRVVLDDWLTTGYLRGSVDAASKVSGRVDLASDAVVEGSEIRGPAIIGSGTVIKNSFIGPYSSLGDNCRITESSLEHCVVLDGVVIEGLEHLEDSVIGQNASIRRSSRNRRAVRLMVGEDSEVLF